MRPWSTDIIPGAGRAQHRRSMIHRGAAARVASVGVAAILAFVTIALAGQGDPARDVRGAPMAFLADQDALPDGIEVHGDWTIDVLEPDGTLVQHVEFENALREEGADLLAAALARGTLLPQPDSTSDFGSWALFLSSVPAARPCNVPRVHDAFLSDGMLEPTGGTLADGCWILATEIGELVQAMSGGTLDLAVASPGTGFDLEATVLSRDGGDALELKGSVVAMADGQLDFVESSLWIWHVTGVYPSVSATVTDVVDFTGTGFGAIDVLSGQEIRVTFALSFQ